VRRDMDLRQHAQFRIGTAVQPGIDVHIALFPGTRFSIQDGLDAVLGLIGIPYVLIDTGHRSLLCWIAVGLWARLSPEMAVEA
jgi:hypothetical protein